MIRDPNFDSFKVDLKEAPFGYMQEGVTIRVKNTLHYVSLIVDNEHLVKIPTVLAYDLGVQLLKQLPSFPENIIVTFTINHRPVELLKAHALKVAQALVRRADAADDWQIQQQRRSQQ